MAEWSLYMVRTENGHLYTGISTDVERRFTEHVAGGKKSAKYLRGKKTLRLVFSEKIGEHALALKMEHHVRRMPKQIKEKLVSGETSLPDISKINNVSEK